MVNAISEELPGEENDDSSRQTPRHRRSLMMKNLDIIEMFQQTNGTNSDRSSITGLSKEAQLCQEREARLEAESLLENCRKELKNLEAKTRLQSDEAEAKLLAEAKSHDMQLFAMQEELDKYRGEVCELEARLLTQVDRKEFSRLRKRLAKQEKLIESLCQQIDGDKLIASYDGTRRVSVEIMSTLTEGDSVNSSEEVEEEFSALLKLQRDLRAQVQEQEQLRQTADQCWVREQSAVKRATELERENQELSTFTQQIEVANQRIMAGFSELQSKMATMVPREALADAEAQRDEEIARCQSLDHRLIEALSAATEAEGKLVHAECAFSRPAPRRQGTLLTSLLVLAAVTLLLLLAVSNGLAGCRSMTFPLIL